MAKAVEVFFSYSHRDESLRDELAKHLTILERLGIIQSWHDRRILSGDEWDGQINSNLDSAQVILLLVSADFLASNYCWDVEVRRAMERYEAQDACVIPVILRDVDWKGAPFGKLQALPTNAKAITSFANRDEAFKNVAQGIRAAVEQLRQTRQTAPPTEKQSSPPSAASPEIEEYRQELAHILSEEGGTIDDNSRIYLDGLRDSLSISSETALSIEQSLLAPYLVYEQTFQRMAAHALPLDEKAQTRLKRLQQRQGLSDIAVELIVKRVLHDHDFLHSERGIDYSPLRDLLKAGDWRAADQETYETMIQAVGKSPGNYFTQHELLTFPCADLHTLDRLWVKYSQGKFGFSVQKQIYVDCGAKLDGEYPGDKIWSDFCDRVGWRIDGEYVSYSDLKANPSLSPSGEFPVLCVVGVWGLCWVGGCLFSRIQTCKL
jgi:hypothetical protein